MNIILLNNFCKRKGSLELCLSSVGYLMAGAVLLVGALAAAGGYYFAKQQEIVQAELRRNVV